MTRTFATDLRAAIISMLFFTALCGVAYPLLMTGVAQAVFPHQANGSIVEVDGQAAGSSLVGQDFSGPEYFHPRPAADDYSGFSGGSNLGPSSAELVSRIEADLQRIRKEDGLAADAPIPVDAVTASASGLDPHISPAYAELQVARVAEARGMTESKVRALVKQHTDGPLLGVAGEPRVNVLLLNLALDER
jgi:potassium-transporting ATPase KdpC subunit